MGLHYVHFGHGAESEEGIADQHHLDDQRGPEDEQESEHGYM